MLTLAITDTSTGKPATALRFNLYRVDTQDGTPQHHGEHTTNSQGTTDTPLLETTPGLYALELEIGEYQEQNTPNKIPSPFLGTVPLMFKVLEESSDYHIDISFNKWSYQMACKKLSAK